MDRHCFDLAPDPALMSGEFPAHLTPAQILARTAFDLDTAMASLPPKQPYEPRQTGNAGVRLRGHLTCSLPEDLLREFGRINGGEPRDRSMPEPGHPGGTEG